MRERKFLAVEIEDYDTFAKHAKKNQTSLKNLFTLMLKMFTNNDFLLANFLENVNKNCENVNNIVNRFSENVNKIENVNKNPENVNNIVNRFSENVNKIENVNKNCENVNSQQIPISSTSLAIDAAKNSQNSAQKGEGGFGGLGLNTNNPILINNTITPISPSFSESEFSQKNGKANRSKIKLMVEKNGYTADFLEVWNVYLAISGSECAGSKINAFVSYKQCTNKPYNADLIGFIKHEKEYNSGWTEDRDGKKYIPAMSVWINQKRWEAIADRKAMIEAQRAAKAAKAANPAPTYPQAQKTAPAPLKTQINAEGKTPMQIEFEKNFGQLVKSKEAKY